MIRPYQPQDRQPLRALCCDVADQGRPIENFFPDRDWAADVLTKYYTDYEPQSSFVAESEGHLVGYVNGCTDNRRYGLVMFWLLLPALIVKGFKRGLFFRREVITQAQGLLRNWRRLFVLRQTSFSSHQGHLHIGVAQHARGQHMGARLLTCLTDHARKAGICELTASVHEANKAACHFFSSQGFVVQEKYPMIMMRGGQKEHYHSCLYVKKIEPDNWR